MEVVAEYVTEDTAWDGHGDGPGYAAAVGQALEDARLGRIDVLLVWALDRLSRRGIEATLSLMRQFSAHGTDVWSLRESWTETSDPHVRQLITAIMAWVAQQESQRRSERVKAGLARRKAQGMPIGRLPGARDARPRRRSGYVSTWEAGGRRRAGNAVRDAAGRR